MTYFSPASLAKEMYHRVGNRNPVMFIDFDGTLAPIQNDPLNVALSQQNKILLASASLVSQAQLIVVSGRDMAFLHQVLTGIPISIAGEHGAVFFNHRAMRMENLSIQSELTDRNKKMLELSEKLSVIESRYPGTFLEIKNTSVAFHYRNIENTHDISEVMERLLELSLDTSYQVIKGKDVFEFSFSGTSKGSFINWWLENNQDKNNYFPISIGDDTTDEFMFEICNKLGGLSIKVGEGPTQASYRLTGTDEVSEFLSRFLLLLAPASGFAQGKV